jgi:hypothetical protein
VQDFLKRIEDPLIPVTMEVLDYSVSYKVNYKIRRRTSVYSGGGKYTTSPSSKVDGSIYYRSPALPSSDNAFIQTGQYGSHQLALSASLALLQAKRR